MTIVVGRLLLATDLTGFSGYLVPNAFTCFAGTGTVAAVTADTSANSSSVFMVTMVTMERDVDGEGDEGVKVRAADWRTLKEQTEQFARRTTD